ncbi:MAG: GTP pyrophosphokinase [Bacillota bacterium]
MDNKKVEEAVKWYKNSKKNYKELTEKTASIIRKILKDNKILYQNLESRVKDLESFERKAMRDKYVDPKTEITDLAGVRIITLFEKDVYNISDLIKENFEIDYSNSEDKSDLLDADRMGYKSVHYVASLSEKHLSSEKYSKFSGMLFEIQIRSILQHAWAEIEHDRNYKLKGNLPRHLQRRFYSLAGMLEIADREFNSLAEEVEEYKKNSCD